LLGTAAGGGLPQWNCACVNCQAAREGSIPSRTQSSLAFSADGKHWFLLNASGDLRAQIEAFPALHPDPATLRNSPIQGVLLTNADLDHVLGLFQLREGGPLHVQAPLEVRVAITSALRLSKVLQPYCGVTWHEPPNRFAHLLFPDGTHSGLSYRAIPLPGHPPRFVSRGMLGVDGHSIAYEIADDQTGGTLLVAPDVAAITPALRDSIECADAILFDGTFWKGTELQEVRPGARSAREMDHLPISEGSLAALREAPAQNKIYVHINNTNPILAAASDERTQVEKAGIAVGYDGMEFEI
jgi:pyrroloquinoline quinone biosynthesis protein B